MDEPAVTKVTLDRIAEHTNDLVVRTNPSGEITYASPQVRSFGYEPEDVIGHSPTELMHPDDQERFLATARGLLRGEFPPSDVRQLRLRTARGDWVWIECDPGIVFGADGRTLELVSVFRDVTGRRAEEQQARERAELFELAFRNSAIGQVMMDLDGTFLRVNEAYCRMVGREESTLRTLNLRQVTHPDDIETDEMLLRRLQAGEILSYERDKRYVSPDGATVWGRATVSVVRNPDGSARLFLAQVQDLSERQAAELALVEIEARYRLIAETTSDIIVMTDLLGTVTYVSPSVRRIGYEPNELIGERLDSLVSPRAADAIGRMRATLLAGEPTEGLRARVLHGATGEPIWLETRMTLLRDPQTGAPTSFLDVIREVGRQVAQEEALATARREAEQAAAAKTQFLANMSHEIRTPLTAVLGFAELLAKRPSLDERAKAYVDRITGAGNALLAIVNDILDFSKLEAGKFEVRPRPTDVAELCEETLHLFYAQADAKAVALKLEIDPALPHVVLLDSDRFRQLLINLIGNAVKFTDHGSVTVRALSAGSGRAVRLEVEDTGPGLDAEQLGHLFQRFSQVDGSTSRRHGGTGLGLAICKGVAEAMGGEIGVLSEPGRRTVFHVVLPAPPVEIPVRADPEANVPSIERVKVLVVDDNAANRELAVRILEAHEAEVVEAASGPDALELLHRQRFDVLLLDLRMPGLDGHEVLARLRAAPGPNREAPVVAFTADVDVGDGMGEFDGVVRKPISANVMVAAVADAVAG